MFDISDNDVDFTLSMQKYIRGLHVVRFILILIIVMKIEKKIIDYFTKFNNN